MYSKFISFFIIFITTVTCFSQTEKKKLLTKFTDEKITIDAKFDEQAWQTAEIATDFIMIAPDNGKTESIERKSEVKIVYNNDAIYIAAKLYDNEADKIRKELTIRDDFATADHFGVFFNGYNDGQQEFRFFVSAAGVQEDMIYTESNGEDLSFNAIWDSKVEITDYGWAVEMKIPYAALRFPSKSIQTWGLNFYREIQRDRQQYSWNLIDNKIGSEANQAGILEGIENIKTPTRLFFIPYVSQYFNANDYQKTKGEFKGGLDIKYGINDAFTLDAILVPDFGQTAFDNVVLNLGPFEQQFNENRPFFTEGTELFSKGNLVYSRRIGGSPYLSAELNADESFVENPAKVNLLNALKISGRTRGGLGIGVLNAITEETEAIIKNDITGETRKVITEPLANYNVIVLDQRFNKNSSVSFINTNVTRNGEYRDANVTGALFNLNTKANTYNLSGSHKYSTITEFGEDNYKTGYATNLDFAETSGKYRYNLGGEYVSKDYDINDLGINFQTHYHAIYGNFNYRILKPNKAFNNFSFYNNYYTEFDNKTGRVQAAQFNFNLNTTSKKNDYLGYGLNFRPIEVYDFYEPRSVDDSRFLTLPENISFYMNLSTNYNRKFAIDVNPSISFANQKERRSFGLYISPRYRFSNKLSLVYQTSFNFSKNSQGYIDEDATNIYFGRRDVTTLSNSLNTKYTINNVMNLNLSVRHYWSFAEYNKFYTLQDKGDLTTTNLITDNYDRNFSTWNLDLSYSWWFAPGSQISILYRNNSFGYSFGEKLNKNYSDIFDNNLSNRNLNHVFSISIRYFIDYNQSKNWFSKK